jgi:dolichyl-diphosphooligosaccharide--protein glycosyltransferase
VDNATVIDWQIKKMAYSLITTPDNSWHVLNSHYSEDVSKYLGDDNVVEWGGNHTYQSWLSSDDANKDCKPISISDAKKLDTIQKICFPVASGLDADYLLIYVAGERIDIPGSNLFLYTLDGGGDESKKYWFMKISNHEPSKFLEYDGITPTPYFMENSTLGKLIPFSVFKYVEPNTSRAYDEHRDGLIPVYLKDIKYMDSENDPFYLVYASPSFYSEIPGPMSTVLIYKINPNYIP